MSDTEPIDATLVDDTSAPTDGVRGDPGDPDGPRLRADERVGPYTILDQLGYGGMSVVYSATHVDSGDRVALKVVKSPSAMNLGAIRREIHGLSRLEHPRVVPVVDTGTHEGRPWFAMPLLEGPTLRTRLRALWARVDATKGPRWEAATAAAGSGETGDGPRDATGLSDAIRLTVPDVGKADDEPGPPPAAMRPPAAAGELREMLELFRELCETLSALHAHGVIHRDLKPENVLLTRDPEGVEHPTLVDFGLMANFGDRQGRESLDGEYALAGTPGYMAPEQILQERVDARADLYALGCMLYEALTSRRPFGRAKGLDLVQRQLYEAPDAPSQWARGIAPELDALVLRLVERRPQARVGHASDAAEVLRRILGRPAQPVADDRADTRYLYRPTLAGRLDTLAELEGLLSRAEDGAGRLALITGRSGIGKTRLAIELMASAARRRLRVHHGACLPLGASDSDARGRLQGAPLHPFRGLLRAIADRCQRLGPGATATYFGADLPILIPYAPELASVPGAEDYEASVGLSGEAAQRRVLQALLDAMGAYAADEPFLFVLDDVQWADPLTMAFLTDIGRGDLGFERFMILGTGRSESERPEFRALRALEEVADFELMPLDADAVASIVEDMLASDKVPKPFTDYLARASDGNPYFVAEYLRTAVDDRLLRREITGEWVLDARIDSSASGRLESLPLPESVELLVLRRVAQLSDNARVVLEAAAVVGLDLDGELLAAVLGRETESVLDPIAELMSHAVLQTRDDGTLSFSHQKVRELTYEDMEGATRRRLHVAAAKALEQRSDDPAILPQLANHWYAAEDDERAFAALVRAGRAALDAYAPASAATPLEKALALLDPHDGRPAITVDPMERARLHRDFAWARYCSGDVSDFLAYSHRALSELGEGTPESSLGWAWRATTHLIRHLGVAFVPEAWLVARGAQRRARYELAAETASALSWGYIYGNSPPRALGLSLIAANLSARAGSEGPRAIPYTMLGATLGSLGLERAADRYFMVARDSAQRVREVGQGFVQRWIEGMHHFNFARWDRGERLVRDVLAIGEETGDVHAIINSRSILSIEAYHRGQLGRCIEHASVARELARQNHYTVLETVSRCQLAAVLIHRGESERAIALTADREDGDLESEGVMTLISRRAIQAGALLRAGQLEAACDAADHAVRLLEDNPSGNMTSVMAHYWLCTVYRAQLRQARAQGRPLADLWDRVRLTRGWADRFARMYPIGEPIALRHRAAIEALMGDETAAERLRVRAAKSAERLGMQAELRLARAGREAPG